MAIIGGRLVGASVIHMQQTMFSHDEPYFLIN